MNKHSPVLAVKPGASVEGVIDLMRRNDAGSVVVLSDSGDLEGIITERDILKAIDTPRSALMPLSARDIMSKTVATCTLDDTEEVLMRRMVECGVQYMPVLAGNDTIAVISMEDLVASRVRKIRAMLEELESGLHLERQLEYFTRNLKPFMQMKLATARMQVSHPALEPRLT